jgi:hypothetical protein
MHSKLRYGWLLLIILAGLTASCLRPASSPPTSPPETLPQQITATASPTASTPAASVPTSTSVSEAAEETTVTPPTPTGETISPTRTAVAENLPLEVPITLLPIEGPINTSQAEISGMDWYQDSLVLLPQYPERFGDGAAGAVFVLEKADILAHLAGDLSGPLQPRPVQFVSSELADRIPGYEGFEAIAFFNDRVYLTIEASGEQMLGYLVAGYVGGDLDYISLDASLRLMIQPQTGIPNLSDESIVIFGSRLVTIYEANGSVVNPSPQANLFDSGPTFLDQLSFPNVEYRLTDATRVDDFGRFWMPNTFFIGDIQLMTVEDPIAEEFGQGETHSQSIVVERLLEFQFSEQGIVRSDSPPIQLQLAGDNQTRNWEAIARLDDLGFLLATDEHPQTLLAFVAASP